MSGHSKWSKVKHQKATTDVVKAAAFTKAARAITIAVRQGQGIADPALNFKLRLAVEKARAVNMPKENIARAIEKASNSSGESFEEIMYEGYGPHGLAVLLHAATDNRNRTVAQVKNVFDKAGGTIATPGSVAYLFEQVGIITVPTVSQPYERLFDAAVDSGATDVIQTEDMYEIYCQRDMLNRVLDSFEKKGITAENSMVIMKPVTPVSYDSDKVDILNNFVESLESLDDIQSVFTNMAG